MRKLISLLMTFAVAGVAWGSDDRADRDTLRGVKAVCTVVEITGPSQEGIPVSRERLQAEVDGRLASSGIPVDKNATTCLYLRVQLLPAMAQNKLPAMKKGSRPTGLFALDLNLQFLQTVALTRDATLKTYAPTWSLSNLATLPAEDIGSTARQITVDLADRFVQAYQWANPK
jgi:hypothetical protein